MLANLDESVIIPLTVAEAKRLADLHLALAQEYRKLAGLPPILTKNVERHPTRLAPLAVEARGTVKR